jgi:two-component system sensor histidine kinase AgrC
MEDSMSLEITLGLYLISYLIMYWFLDYKLILDRKECLILSGIILVNLILLFSHLVPIIIPFLLFLVQCILYMLFYKKKFNIWLVSVFMLNIEYILVVFSWFITFDLPRLIYGLDFLHSFGSILLFYATQLVLLFLFTIILKRIFSKHRIIEHFRMMTTDYKLLSFSFLFLIAGFSIFRNSRTYPEDTEIYIFSLLVIMLFISPIFYVLWTVSKQQYEVTQLNLENKILLLEKEFSNHVKAFEHDYKNLLIVLSFYLDAGNYTDAKNYLNNLINYSKEKLNSTLYTQVSKVKCVELENYLYVFSSKCEKNSIVFNLDVTRVSTHDYQMNPIDRVRCLSIMADNAFEAVESFSNASKKRFIDCSIHYDENYKTISFKNACEPDIDITNLLTPKFTTKDNHSGQGLATLNKIVKANHGELDLSAGHGYFSLSINIC